MDTVRNQFAGFVKDEYVLRDVRISAVQRIDRNIQRSRWIVLLVLGLGIGLYMRQQLGQVARLYDSALTTAELKTEALQTSEASLREAQARLRQYSEDLEKTVAQRTAKLQEMAFTRNWKPTRIASRTICARRCGPCKATPRCCPRIFRKKSGRRAGLILTASSALPTGWTA